MIRRNAYRWSLLAVAVAGVAGSSTALAASSSAHTAPQPSAKKVKHHHNKPHAQAVKGKTKAKFVPVYSNGGKGGSDPGNDYPAVWRNAPQDSEFDQWREYNRECTSFVAWALSSRNGFNMPFWDNAIGWGPDAQRRGYAVNSTPAIGSVAWENKPPYGHVAYVVAISGGSVTIEEYNEHGNGTYDERTVPSSAFTGYIHFRDLAPTAFTPTPAPVSTPAPAPTVQTVTQTVSTPSPTSTTSSATPVTTTTAASTSTPTPTTTPAPTPTTWNETTGSVAHTWTNYTNAGGTQGPSIASNQTVQIACKVTGFQVADGNTWWYRIYSAPWNSAYYVSADAFYNDGATSGSLHGTPFVDNAVANC